HLPSVPEATAAGAAGATSCFSAGAVSGFVFGSAAFLVAVFVDVLGEAEAGATGALLAGVLGLGAVPGEEEGS
ncbi:hypothetical protein JZU71_02695, partial [bacterium]|nr:hypothetical protein [bacterium]